MKRSLTDGAGTTYSICDRPFRIAKSGMSRKPIEEMIERI
jgi:hypothetical protein